MVAEGTVAILPYGDTGPVPGRLPGMAGAAGRAGTADVSVRVARSADVPAVAALQLRVWYTAYARIVPAGALASVSEVEAEQRWREAVAHPPTSRHQVLVEVASNRLVGFVALGPATDGVPIAGDASSDGEIYTLLIDIDARRAGHGSRLLAAGVECLQRNGFARVVGWLFVADAATRAFYEGAGWAPDGARRALDMGEPVEQLRLHTDVT